MAILTFTVVGYTLSVENDFCLVVSQFSVKCHAILQALFSVHVATFMKILYGLKAILSNMW